MNQLRIFYSTIFRLKMKNESSWLNDAVMMLQWWMLTICRYFKFSSLRNHLSTMQAQQILWMQQSFSRVLEELLLWCANVELIYINLMLLRFSVQTIFTKDITSHPIPLVSTTHHYVLICALQITHPEYLSLKDHKTICNIFSISFFYIMGLFLFILFFFSCFHHLFSFLLFSFFSYLVLRFK